jgi:hypothetical protein
MPFMFTIDLRTIQRGLDSLFPFKPVPFLLLSRSFLTRSFGVGFNLCPDHAFHIVYNFIPSPKVPIHILHLGNIVNHVFEDLRKTKAPNSGFAVTLIDIIEDSCWGNDPQSLGPIGHRER